MNLQTREGLARHHTTGLRGLSLSDPVGGLVGLEGAR